LSKQGRFGVVFAQQIDADVSDAAFRLFVRLSTYADREGACWPGVGLLAELSGVQPRQIYKLLQELVDAGLISREARARPDGSQCSSMTYLHVPTGQGGMSSQDRGGWATVTPLEHPNEHIKEQPTTFVPSGPEGETMPVGALDDDAEMPEHGHVPKPKKERYARAPQGNTHHRVIYEFEREMVKHNCGRGFTAAVLHRTTKNLHDEGYSYDEIVLLVRTFFARSAQDVRAKRKEIDPAVMFTARIGQLKAQMESTVDSLRSGESSVDRGKQVREDRIERMRRNVEGESA
jgi:hypothetical protein